ncbi:MAG: cyclic nucleotide-binding domain-containing protein [Actinobacteria bacterium]|nr:MAG: cyclic nucleotide-binding domain-containing protein [Actinomycetota bacterium]
MTASGDATIIDHQLRSHPLVRGLSDADIDRLAAHARMAEFEPHEVVFEEGGVADAFFLIRTGVVALKVMDAGGVRRIESLHEGSALGWSWLFPPFTWQFTAQAETPVRGIAVDAAALRAEFEADPAFGYRMIARIAEVMAKRLYATRRQVVNLMGY